MSNYHFEDNSKDFGATVRLDSLKEKVREQAGEEGTREFPPVKPMRKQSQAKNLPKEPEPMEETGEDGVLNRNFFKAVLFAGLIVFVCIFVAAMVYMNRSIDSSAQPSSSSSGNTPTLSEALEETTEGLAIVLPVQADKSLSLYDIAKGEPIQLDVDLETKFLDETGHALSFSDFQAGDVVVYTLKGESQVLSSLALSAQVWKKENVVGATVDFNNKTLTLDGTTYQYEEDTYFLYQGKTVSPGDISATDTLTIFGQNNSILSLRVEQSHGYVYFKNRKMVENLQVLVDEEEAQLDLETGLMELGCGRHLLNISGDNIEEYMVYVNVDDKDRTTIDLAEATSKVEKGIVRLTIEPAGALVYVDGVEQPAGETELEVAAGSHKVEVFMEGYERWSKTVTVGKDPVELQVTMKKIAQEVPYVPKNAPKQEPTTGNCTVYTDPGWAKVYINGEYVGVSPVMTRLPYGSYEITAEMDGESNTEAVEVKGPDTRVTINLEE